MVESVLSFGTQITSRQSREYSRRIQMEAEERIEQQWQESKEWRS